MVHSMVVSIISLRQLYVMGSFFSPKNCQIFYSCPNVVLSSKDGRHLRSEMNVPKVFFLTNDLYQFFYH